MTLKTTLVALMAVSLCLTGCPAPWQGIPSQMTGYQMGAQVADGVVTVSVPPDSASANVDVVVLEVRRNGETLHRVETPWNASNGLTVRIGSAEKPVKDGDTLKFGSFRDGVNEGFRGGFFIPKAPNTDAIDWVP